MSHGSKYGICVVKIYDIVYFAMIPEFLGPNLVASAKRLRLDHRWVFLFIFFFFKRDHNEPRHASK